MGGLPQMLLVGVLLFGAEYPPVVSAQESGARPDNTKTNKRDSPSERQTADRQKEDPSDRDISQKLRRAVVKDKSLSTDAHNVKIITQGGQVILAGPVRTLEERDNIEAKAMAVVGQGRVTNQLEVAPKQ
jgi:hyperosmotically inducible protein